VKNRPKILDRLLEEFRRHESFCVVGHIRPDGDCVGSQIALTLALQALGKKAVCWNEDPVPAKLKFLDPDKMLQRPAANGELDCVVAVDCASLERMGRAAQCIGRRQVLLNIDHHASNTRYGDVNWVAARAPSTGELIFRLLKEAGWPITQRIADCLFTAVSTDTGSFQYATTLPSTYHVAAELVKRGANLARICEEVYQSYSMSRVRLVRHLYNKFRLTHNDQIAYLWLRDKDFSRTGAAKEDAEGLIDHIRAIEPVVVAIVFEEIGPALTRVSLRSKNPALDVNQIASQFGGGGHAAAAGARIPGSPLSAQRRVVAAVRKALDALPQ
jgi:phosphoesterase RecJ-like protein